MKYFLIAGEPSGDLHGSNLMRGLKESDPEATFMFWGGDKMAEVGGAENLGLHYRKSSFFGIFQVLFNLFTIVGQLSLCKRQIDAFNPDVVILIDYAGFNLKIAKYAKSRGLKCYYYIAPKVWAWNKSRIKLIKRYVDELFIIFPFEQSYFEGVGVKAHFEGNPLVDSITENTRNMRSREEFLEANNLGERPIVALVAGSRASEIKANLPLMRYVADRFPDYQFVVAGVNWLPKSVYDKLLYGSDIRLLDNQTYELIYHSEAAIVTSGTATLETALIGTPEVVVYRVPLLHKLLMPIVLKIPYVSLVNINLGRESVREIIDATLDPTEVVTALCRIVEGGVDRARMLEDYAELKEIIGAPAASSRFARRMVELLKR